MINCSGDSKVIQGLKFFVQVNKSNNTVTLTEQFTSNRVKVTPDLYCREKLKPKEKFELIKTKKELETYNSSAYIKKGNLKK